MANEIEDEKCLYQEMNIDEDSEELFPEVYRDFDTVQEYVSHKIFLSDEKLLEIIKQTKEQWEAQHNSHKDEEEKNNNRGEEKGVIDNMNELLQEKIDMKENQKELFNKFKDLKNQNDKFKVFIQSFKLNEE